MGQPSLFDQHFSPAEQAKLAAWLDGNPAMSVDDFRALLAERGLEVARSTAHKEKRRIEDLGRRMRNSRMAMDSLAEGLEGKNDSKRSRALIEMARTIVFEFQESLLERGGEALDAKDVARLGRLLKDLMMAGRYNQDYDANERKLGREEAVKAVDGKLAEAENAATDGDPRDAFRRIRQELYGLFDDE